MTESGAVVDELRVRRLAVVDEQGAERIVGQVVDGRVTLEVVLADRGRGRSSVLLFAAPQDLAGLGPGLGLQVWADGNAVVEINVWDDGEGWLSELYSDRDGQVGSCEGGRRGL